MKKNRKILFVSHEASRTGAPIVLLQLLKWLKQNGGLQFEILLKKGGPLEADFAALAPTTILQPSFAENWVHKICRRLHLNVPFRFSLPAKVVRHARHCQTDLVYVNTVVLAADVKALANAGFPTLWHIHEMPFVINYFEDGRPFRDASPAVTAFIAAAEGVKQGLISDFAVPTEKIKVIHEFVPQSGNESQDLKAIRESVRQELAFPPDAFIAGMCGTIEWRKGADLFLTVAKHLATEFPGQEIYFLWIGAPDSRLTQKQVDHDIRLAGLAGRVKFIGGKADSRRYLAALDVFVLMSREDPFPLVMLEAASLGLPIICFRGTGGGPEFVGDDAGIIVEYGDTLAIAKALVQLSGQPAWRQKLGLAARQKVLSQYTVEIQAPKIAQFIEQVAQNIF
jgi:glycosyltransferase involved in cell wall biosynthesis